jgi:predicted transposase/invertase (TIGR01784 family)
MIKIDDIHKAHNNVFIKAFSDPENVKVLLKMALPEPVRNAIDFSKIEIGFTTYVSDDIKDYYSDIVVKTRIKTGDQEEIKLDIYILVEHKSSPENKSLVQMLKYMYLEWQKDIDQKRPLRVIIPLVFYHGKEAWNVPRSFADQFNVNEEIKAFLLNYRYILFDTKDWNFLGEANRELKDNVFLLTALVLLKSAYNEDMETIKAIFRLWYEKGFIKNKEKVIFFLLYVSYIRDISLEELKKTLEESNIAGGDIMSSLARRLIEQGIEQGVEQGIEQGIEQGVEQGIEQGIEKGAKNNAKETARRMLSANFSIKDIAKFTGLTEQEIKELKN